MNVDSTHQLSLNERNYVLTSQKLKIEQNLDDIKHCIHLIKSQDPSDTQFSTELRLLKIQKKEKQILLQTLFSKILN